MRISFECCALLLATALSLGTVSVAAAEPAKAAGAEPAAVNAEAEIRALEEKDRQAMLAGDAAALAELWASDLIVTVPSNRIRSGAEILGFVRSRALAYSAFARDVERVAVHGDIAIAMGSETVTSSAGADSGKRVQRRFTDVFTRIDGKWRLVARQVSIAT